MMRGTWTWATPRTEPLRRPLASACLVLCLVVAGLAPAAADVAFAAAPDGTDQPRDFHRFDADATGFDWVNSYLLSYLSEYVYLAALDVEEAEFEAAFRAQIDGLGLTFVDYVTKPWSLEGLIEDTQLVVVETEDAIIFVFRGSEQLADWVTDGAALTAGGVHLGFSTAVASVLPEIRAHIDASAGKKVWLTGHSLGGALATVTALRLGFAQEADLRDVQGITTYGGPRALAKTALHDAVGPYRSIYPAARTQRWVNNEDLVPHIPTPYVPPDLFYSHVGQVNNIIPDEVGGCLVDRDADELSLSLNLVNGVRDHAGFYYLTRIYTNMPNDLRLLMPEPPYPDPVLDCDLPLDVTPPVITPTVEGTIGDNGWYVSDVTVSFTVQDPNSQIESETGCGTTVIDTDTVGTTVTCTATSTGGTATQRVEIKRDATAPVPDLGGPYEGFEGDAIVLDGSASLDATSGIAHAEWSSAQPGLLGATADPATFVPADNGDYEFTLTLTDAAGNRSSAKTSVAVRNAAPTVDAGSDRTAVEGELVELAVSFNDPGSLDTHDATIDWGDGTSPDVGIVTAMPPFGPPGSLDGLDGQVAGEHVYADNGAYTVEICVTDKDADTGCDQLVLTVANVAPTVEVATIGDGPAFFLPFVEIPVEARFNDPGTLDTHTAQFDWGDGSFSNGAVSETPFGPPGSVDGLDGTVSGTHTYAAPATYEARLEVTDKDDGVGGVDAEILVLSPIDALGRVTDDLADIAAGSSDDEAITALLAAQKHLTGANEPSRSGALQRLEDGDRSAAVLKLGAALEELEHAAAADLSLELGLVQLLLTQIAESIAAGIYVEARDALDPPSRGQLRQLTRIEAALEAGRTARAAGQWTDAVAWFHDVTRRSSDLL